MSMRQIAVTGGSGGIGRAIAKRFVSLGDTVTLLARDRTALDRALATLDGDVRAETCDVTSEESVQHAFERIGDVDVLVNNAGQAMSAPVAHQDLESWNRMLAVNATGVFLCTRAVIGAMKKRDAGRIVTVASVAGLVGARYTAAYAASKHAAVGLMRATACEVAGTGVTANCVCPGFVDTEMTERTIARIIDKTGRSREETIAELTKMSPLGRLIAPDEVAEAVCYLASAEAAAVNGQTLVIDGGGIQS